MRLTEYLAARMYSLFAKSQGLVKCWTLLIPSRLFPGLIHWNRRSIQRLNPFGNSVYEGRADDRIRQ